MASKPAWSHDAKTGPVRRFGQLFVFACEGLLCIIDERPAQEGDYTVITPRDMLERIAAINRPYRNRTPAELSLWQRREQAKQKAESQGLAECVKEAQAMGDPTDPKVQAFWAKQRRNVTISFSPRVDAAGYPKLPDLPLGKFTGRTTEAPIIHPPPRRKTPQGLILLD